MSLFAALLSISASRVLSDCDGCTISSQQMPFICVDLTGGSTKPGTLLELWACNGLKNQEWSWVGSALRYKADTTMCVAVNGAIANDAKLVLEKCNGQTAQQFGMDKNGRVFVGGAQQFCLSPVNDDFSPGNNIRLFACAYYFDQQWLVTTGIGPPPVPKPDFSKVLTLVSEHSPSQCMDVSGGKAKAGTAMEIWDCNGLQNQQFLFSGSSITSTLDKSMCLEIDSMKQGAGVHLQKCASKTTQKFGYDAKMATVYAAASDSDATLCLDPGPTAKRGTGLMIWGCNGQEQQKWYVHNAGAGINSVALV